ncbi:MAG: DUF349 domain-containing protein, partial [Mycobacterium sp.]|nr:DUF349 domain-containing protein [Mycobacterium sp.]
MTITDPGGPQDSEHNAPKPKPGPRPGPGSARPGPGPAAATKPATVSVVPASDPRRFGRVDPDGTVWLITASG